MLLLAKIGCLVLFAAGLVGWSGAWSGGLARGVEIVAALVAAVHVIEVPLLWTLLRRAPGSLVANVLQTLLFGAFHWLPLKRAARG